MKQTIRLMIVDDEPISQQTIANLLTEYEQISVCAKAFSIREARQRMQITDLDAVFLDVELGRENGFDLAAEIRQNYPRLAIIFVTGHMELAIHGYDYEPLDYLVKPVDPRRLERAVERLQKAILTPKAEDSDSGEIGLETAIGSYFLPIRDILYCELRNRKVYVGLRNDEEICCNTTIDKMEKQLKNHGFLKVYQSVLVRQEEIISVEKDQRGQTYHVRLHTNDLIFPASRKIFYEARKITRNPS